MPAASAATPPKPLLRPAHWRVGSGWMIVAIPFQTNPRIASPVMIAPSGVWADLTEVKSACTAEKSATIKAIQDRGTLVWATGLSLPTATKDAEGKFIGVEPDNAKEFAEILGVEPVIRDFTYDLLPPAVATGTADIVGANLYITETRRKAIDFSDPYNYEGSVFVVLASRDELNTIEDLNRAEVRVITGTGTGLVDLAAKFLPNSTRTTADISSVPEVQFLVAGQAVATMVDTPRLPVMVRAAQGSQLKFIGKRGVVDGVPASEDMIDPYEVGFGVRKGDPEFLSCVNAWVRDLADSGRFQKRWDHWLEILVR
jgi:polar amino acid transport system substrate-binding protein